MADTVLTMVQFEDLIQAVTVDILGWADLSPSKNNDVRIGWLNAPAFKRSENIVFLKGTEQEGQYNKQRDVISVDRVVSVSPPISMVTQRTGYTRIMQVDYLIYGSDSYENAQAIRDGMFSPDIRYRLANQNLYLIPNMEAPKRSPELFATQWWERTDLTISFNELVIREPEVNPIDSAEVITQSDVGILSDVEITSTLESITE